MNTGDLPGQDVARHPAGVRAVIVAQANRSENQGGKTSTPERRRVMTAGAKGGREAEPSSEGQREATSPEVPATGKQGEEDLWQRHKAERGVWSEKMLVALEKGVKGAEQQRDRQPTGCPAGVSESESTVWFSLIDKIYAPKTLELAWAKVQSNAGACGAPDVVAKTPCGAWTSCCKADSFMSWTWTSKGTSTVSRTRSS